MKQNIFSRSEVIEESCSKDDNDSEIESEKLVESSTEKDTKDKDIDESDKLDNDPEVDRTPVVVRRRPKKATTAPTTSYLPAGEKHFWSLKLLKNYLTKFDSKYNVLNILFCNKSVEPE